MFYKDYLDNFYKIHKNLSSLSYDDHHKLLMDDCFGWSNFFRKNLEHLEHVVYELVINDELLQKKWSNENNLKYAKKNWMQEILILQINHYNPDIIIWEVPSFFNASINNAIRNKGKKILNIGHFCSLYPDLNFFKNFDIVLACSEFQNNQLKILDIKSNILRHGFETSILKKVKNTARPIDISFVGAIGSKVGFHSDRYNLTELLLKNTDIEIWTPIQSKINILHENIMFFCDSLRSHTLHNFGINNSIKSNAFRLKKQYPTRIHDAVYGLNMFDILSQSKITINCHCNSHVTGDYAGNMRLFEATGMGALLITDWKKNLPDLFEPDNEVITYKTQEECVEKVKYYLEHDKEREMIARAGQERTLKDHTFENRMKELIGIIDNHFNLKVQ